MSKTASGSAAASTYPSSPNPVTGATSLSKGAIAGISVGVTVLAVVVFCAVFWAIRSHRRLQVLKKSQNPGVPESKYELAGGQGVQTHELQMGSEWVHGLQESQWGGRNNVGELDAGGFAGAELAGSAS